MDAKCAPEVVLRLIIPHSTFPPFPLPTFPLSRLSAFPFPLSTFSISAFQLFSFSAFHRDPLRVPIKVAFEAVDDVARLFQAVELAGVDDQFSGNSKAAQGLIHLFGI